MTQLLSRQFPTARKEHKCDYCSGEIHIGQKYERTGLVSDGEMYTWKSHARCQEIAVKLKMFEDADDGVTEEFFRTDIQETYIDMMIGAGIFKKRNTPTPPFFEMLDYVSDKIL